jgi:hypothetical protein
MHVVGIGTAARRWKGVQVLLPTATGSDGAVQCGRSRQARMIQVATVPHRLW